MHVSLPTALEEFVLRMLGQIEHWKLDARSKIDIGWDQAKAGHVRMPEQVRDNLAARKAAWKREHGGK